MSQQQTLALLQTGLFAVPRYRRGHGGGQQVKGYPLSLDSVRRFSRYCAKEYPEKFNRINDENLLPRTFTVLMNSAGAPLANIDGPDPCSPWVFCLKICDNVNELPESEKERDEMEKREKVLEAKLKDFLGIEEAARWFKVRNS